MAWNILRTLVNRGGVSYDSTKTSVIFAEDMNKIKDNLTELKDTKVEGPASATNLRIAIFDGTTGKIIKVSPVSISAEGNLAGIGGITCADTVFIQSINPGFWLDETGAGNKGAYLVLDAGDIQIQRRAQGYGGFEANPFIFRLSAPNNSFYMDGNGCLGLGGAPNVNAVLDLQSTSRAFMPPRMTTTQRDAIANPTEGMVIYNTTTHVLNFRNASAWGAV